MPEPVRLELEAVLRCPQCAGVPYKLYRRQVSPGSPVWEHVLWSNRADIPPPVSAERITCPDCGIECRRAAP